MKRRRTSIRQDHSQQHALCPSIWFAVFALAIIASSCSSTADLAEAANEPSDQLVADTILGLPTFEEAAAATYAAVLERDDFVVGCMTAEGFPYLAPIRARTVARESRTFGMSDSITPASVFADAADVADDPNRPFLDSLGPAPRVNYDNKLDSCQNAALEQIQPAVSNVVEFDPSALAVIERLNDAVVADERVRDASEDWIGCVRSAGYSFDSIDDMWLDLSGRSQSFVPPIFDGINRRLDDGMSEEELVNVPLEDLLSDEELANFVALQEYEIELEANVGQCMEVYDGVYDDVYAKKLEELAGR